MPPRSALPAAIVSALELASKCVSNSGPATIRAPHVNDDSDLEPPVDPMSLHCWLIEKALHHESFAHPALQDVLKRLRHRLPPRQFFSHVSDMPAHRRHANRWRPLNGYQKPWWRAANTAYGPRPPPPASPASPACPADEYCALDALCAQMTERAID